MTAHPSAGSARTSASIGASNIRASADCGTGEAGTRARWVPDFGISCDLLGDIVKSVYSASFHFQRVSSG